MVMIQKLFPYQLHLHIFQLDEYDSAKFISWIAHHFLTRTIENKKPLVWTQKAQAVYYLSLVLAVIVLIMLTFWYQLIGFFIGILLATQAYLFVILASFLLFPIETEKKMRIKKETERKLASLKKLKIIGVTGSYGKTSVKEFLYQILRTKYAVLRTPESYNTPYGIAKVVDLELDDSYDYFICEMGAYRRGDIKEICDMVHPQFGIVTGINEQHLETFGSIENTIKGKFELLDALPENRFGVVNGDNESIKNTIAKYKNSTTYGFSDDKFSLKTIKQTSDGSTFSLVLDGKMYQGQTKLLGNPNVQNILGAATMSYLLGMKPHEILAAIKKMKPVHHRLEITHQENMTIIDDAYNSNVNGFQEAIALLTSFHQPTVFVTPGIVDLGDKTFSIHKKLGELLNDIDYVFLVGKSERTKGLKEGMTTKQKIIEVKTLNEIWEKIADLHLTHPVVLLENDLPDNY